MSGLNNLFFSFLIDCNPNTAYQMLNHALKPVLMTFFVPKTGIIFRKLNK